MIYLYEFLIAVGVLLGGFALFVFSMVWDTYKREKKAKYKAIHK